MNGKQPDTQAVLQRFYGLFKSRISSILEEGRQKTAWQEKSDDYSSELKILRQHCTPFIWGVGTSLTLFLTFRISKYTGKFIGFNKSGQMLWENLERKKKLKAAGIFNQQESQMQEGLSIPSDLLLSLFGGISTSLFLLEGDKVMEDVSRVPLVQGRSLISDEFCTSFMQEHSKYGEDFWSQSQNTDRNSNVCLLNEFVKNCKKRRNVENYLNNRNIPSPGVNILNEVAKTEMFDDENTSS